MSIKIEKCKTVSDHRFEVLLSFADSEREYARAMYEICQANGIEMYFDEEFKHEAWAKI